MCSDTSEVRDVVVLLQHGQGGGVQVVGQACTAHCWCWRVLATTAISPTGAVQRQGGGVPGPTGGVFKGTCEHQRWRERKWLHGGAPMNTLNHPTGHIRMGRWCHVHLSLCSPFKTTPEARTYLVDCNSEGNDRACSVRSHPGSCWNWGWTACADAGIFPRRPGYEKHAVLSQSADSAGKKVASPGPPIALRLEPTSDIHLE